MIQRSILPALRAHLNQKEITLIVGARQAGKTTLMEILKKELDESGQKTVYLNLDRDVDRVYFDSQADLIDHVRLKVGDGPAYVFVDEIQRRDDAGLFLKGIYDAKLPYKLIVSGSGSLELKEKIHESLAGRKRVFEVETLSFSEFVNYRTGYAYKDKWEDFFSRDKSLPGRLLGEYMRYGGYPRVVLAASEMEKILVLEELVQSYVERDIQILLGVQKSEEFRKLMEIFSHEGGMMLNLDELGRELGLDFRTLKKFIWYMEKTFMVDKVPPFSRNPRKEIVKSPVYYYRDLGIRNYLSGEMGSGRKGFLFQNLAYRFLRERTQDPGGRLYPGRVGFWRTKDKAEVDFVVSRGELVVPVEVKYSELRKPELGRSLRSFIDRYRPTEAWVMNLSLNQNVKVNETKVVFVPYYLV